MSQKTNPTPEQQEEYRKALQKINMERIGEEFHKYYKKITGQLPTVLNIDTPQPTAPIQQDKIQEATKPYL